LSRLSVSCLSINRKSTAHRVEKGMIKQIKQNVLSGKAGQFSALVTLFYLLFFGNAHASHDVFLVMSSNAEPYQQAADALQSTLTKQGVKTQVYFLDTLVTHPPNFSQGANKSKIWVVIGSRAAAIVHEILPESTSLIYCMVADPEKIGLVGSRKNVVGVSLSRPVKEQLCIIQKAIPAIRSIGMLYRSSSPKSRQTLLDMNTYLPSDWELQAVDVDEADSMSVAISQLLSHKIDIIWTMADSSIYNRATVNSLLLASLRQQIPVFGFSGSFVKAGALLGLEADPALQGEYAARLVMEKIGENRVDESISSGVNVAVNRVVASRFGISLPDIIIDPSCDMGAH
jgi:putative tryptophan/tyrosine transport system substrate-binding protein